VEIQEFARQYGTKTDEELLRLALDSADLTFEAGTALSAELSKRNLHGSERFEAFRQEELQQKRNREKDPGKFWFISGYGIGRKRFGKADYSYSSETGIERFKTTVFVVMFWVPLVPTGSYRVERERAWLSDGITVLERLPLDWEQILKVWIVAAGSILVLIWALKLLPIFLARR
jgi:hypothetical protein